MSLIHSRVAEQKRGITHLHLSMSPLGDQCEESDAVGGRQKKQRLETQLGHRRRRQLQSATTTRRGCVMMTSLLVLLHCWMPDVHFPAPVGPHAICCERSIVVRVYEAIRGVRRRRAARAVPTCACRFRFWGRWRGGGLFLNAYTSSWKPLSTPTQLQKK